MEPRPILLEIPKSNKYIFKEKPIKSENIENKELEKKALKKWYKAKLSFNEKIPKLVEKGYEKWLEDVEKTGFEFGEEHK